MRATKGRTAERPSCAKHGPQSDAERPIIESFMAAIFPFAALRPAPHAAAAVAAVPYDVVNTDEARALYGRCIDVHTGRSMPSMPGT